MIYKANILVVDDDIAMCKGITRVLKDEGYRVFSANNGHDALETFHSGEKFAVIILDLMLPDIRGLELLEIIKKENPDVTVIMATGYPSIKTAVQAIKLGAFDYIPKPFTPDELRSLVARALERRFLYEEIANRMQIREEKLVEISIPSGLYCIKEHSWASINPDGHSRIGIHHLMVRIIKDISSIEFPRKKQSLQQSEVCIKIIDSKNQSHSVRTPLSGQVMEVNDKLQKDISKMIYDPYGEGWLISIKPDNLPEDLEHLEILQSASDR